MITMAMTQAKMGLAMKYRAMGLPPAWLGGKRKGDRLHDIARRNAHQPIDDKLVAGPQSSGNQPAVTDGPYRVDGALLDLVAGPHHQCRRVATLVAADPLLRHSHGMLLESPYPPSLTIPAGPQRDIRVGH